MLLNEGLRANDLLGMMSNVVSVDEYESKIDDSAVVIAFSVNDRHAAADANRFIQKSYVDILDSEVSAAPDQNGNYLVFIEMPMNEKAAKSVAQLCSDMSSLGGFKEWKVRLRGHGETAAMPASKIEGVLRSMLESQLKEFFKNSNVNSIVVENVCMLRANNYEVSFKVADLGEFEKVATRNKLRETAIDLSVEGQRLCRNLKAALGAAWTVEKIGEHVAIYNVSESHLILITA